ncbi:tumor necrosis factor ligand superfamily member 12-like isoform X8 [Alligator sinensis]|uniref:Tumor necrosis factor ligand superfamily member 12-like isoform X8 n=1 Tax=Alligator sinensis TaxID=38654 RepID=A0A3Q0FS63_ALLSI|nr:tumor necrosis factor ligand superfamily member 12-like isoform X8 [Alligator sinensis]
MDQAGTRRHRRTGESSAPGSGWGHWEPEPLGSLQAGGVPAHVSPLPTATKGKRPRPRKSTPTPLYAAHYKVQPADGQTGIYTAGPDGTIRGWAETWLNASSPLRYDEARGIFTVTHGGLYYVYAQAHFDEAAWVYVKLELALGVAPALRCLHQLPPPSAGPPEPQLRGCRVAGLLRLPSGATLRLGTVPRVRLKPDASLTHLGLFQLR